MRSLFDVDSPLMNGLGKIFDCILLSLCWVAASLPVVTMGAACGALYRTVYRCVRHDGSGPLKMFWRTWRDNLKLAVLTWLPILAAYVVLVGEALVLRGMLAQGQPVGRVLGIVMVLIGVVTVWAAYCTSYCVRFNGTLKEILWLSFYLVLSHPLMSIAILLLLALGTALALMVPFLVLFAPALICLAISMPMETVYRKHMRPEDLERVQREES